MKSHAQNYLFLFLIIGVLAFLLFQKPQTVKVKVPAIVGSISPAPISYLEPKGEPLVIEWKHSTITSKNPVNDSLISIYRDSLGQIQNELERERERFKLYLDAVTYRDFESQFEDPFLKLKVKGTVQGYLKNIEIQHYEIKEREITKPKRLGIDISVYAGYGLGTNFQLTPQVGIGISKTILRL